MSYPSPRDLLNALAGELADHPERLLLDQHGTGARGPGGEHLPPQHPAATAWRATSLINRTIGPSAEFGVASSKPAAHDGKRLMSECERLLQLAARGSRVHEHAATLDARGTMLWFRLAAMLSS